MNTFFLRICDAFYTGPFKLRLTFKGIVVWYAQAWKSYSKRKHSGAFWRGIACRGEYWIHSNFKFRWRNAVKLKTTFRRCKNIWDSIIYCCNERWKKNIFRKPKRMEPVARIFNHHQYITQCSVHVLSLKCILSRLCRVCEIVYMIKGHNATFR